MLRCHAESDAKNIGNAATLKVTQTQASPGAATERH